MLRPVRQGQIPEATALLARKVHPRGTVEMRVRDALGPLFEDFTGGRFAGMYCGMGKPGLSPALLAMVTVLQFLHNLSDREAAEAAADRTGIEGTISQAVRGPDLRHPRYRGMPKAHLQNILTCIAINISRLGDHFAARPKPPRRPTHIHELCTANHITATT